MESIPSSKASPVLKGGGWQLGRSRGSAGEKLGIKVSGCFGDLLYMYNAASDRYQNIFQLLLDAGANVKSLNTITNGSVDP